MALTAQTELRPSKKSSGWDLFHAQVSGRFVSVSNLHTQRGMSLVEVVIYLFLIGTITVVFGAFFTDILYGRSRSIALLDVQENARLAMQRMVTEIRQAKAVDVTGSLFAANLAATSSAGRFVGFLSASSTLNPTRFTVASGVLQMFQDAMATTSLTASSVRVTDLQFKYYTIKKQRSVDIALTLEYALPLFNVRNASASLFSAATLRNR